MLPKRAFCAVSIGAALLGCGRGARSSDADQGAKLDSCSPNALLDLKPAVQVDAVELRMVCNAESPPGVTARMLRSSGASCASGACAAEVEALDARLQGWDVERPPAHPCKQYVVGMRGDHVVVSAASDPELKSFLGPIDTRAEAELLVGLHDIPCYRAGERDGRFVIVSSEPMDRCPNRMHDVVFAVDAQGRLERLQERPSEGDCGDGASSR